MKVEAKPGGPGILDEAIRTPEVPVIVDVFN